MNEQNTPQTPQEKEALRAEKKAQKAAEKTAQKANRLPLKEKVRSPRFRHGAAANLITAAVLVVLVLVNVLVSALGERFPSMNLDMTTGSLNSLSDTLKEVTDSVAEDTELFVLASESAVKGDQILTNYGIKYSQVANLCAKIAERNPKIKVTYKDLDADPSFANKYSGEKLSTGDILVQSPTRYWHLAYSDLFSISSNSYSGGTSVYSSVDSALASALSNATAKNMSVVSLATGHQEQLQTDALKKVLSSNNFENKDFNLLTEEIPQNTQLLVLATPSSDYTADEIEKLDQYLRSTDTALDRSLLVLFYPNQPEMPNLTAFLKEWGIEPQRTYIVESDSGKYLDGDPTSILAYPQSEVTLNKNNAYTNLVTPASLSMNLLFTEQNGITTYSLLKSSETSYPVNMDQDATGTEKNNQLAQNIAVMAEQTVNAGGTDCKASIVAFGSSPFFVEGILNSSTFQNGTWTADLARYVTGNDSGSAVNIIPVQTNAMDISLSNQASHLLGLGVFTVLIPLCFAVAGIVVYRRRRKL